MSGVTCKNFQVKSLKVKVTAPHNVQTKICYNILKESLTNFSCAIQI